MDTVHRISVDCNSQKNNKPLELKVSNKEMEIQREREKIEYENESDNKNGYGKKHRTETKEITMIRK